MRPMADFHDRLEDWYPRAEDLSLTREERQAWYAGGMESGRREDVRPDPASPYHTPAQDLRPEDPDQRRKNRVRRIIAICLCAAILLAAGGATLLRQARSWRHEITIQTPGFSYSSSSDEGEEAALPAEEPYDDFRVYFENYYTGSDSVDIPRAAVGTGMVLDLAQPQGEPLSLQEIYDRVSPAVVGVIALRGGVEYSWGTGVLFTPDGYLVTNTHIISGCDGARIVFMDGAEYEALLVGEDSASDIAVLKVEGQDLPFAVFGDSGSLRVGDQVAAIGNPLGEEYAGTMTDGIVSAISRNVKNNGHTMTLLQTNAALNEGNSGGPLVNAWGQVVGITNMKIMSSFYATVEGIGFAIPSAVVKEVADQLMAKGAVSGQPSLGIMAAPVTDEARKLYGLPEGVYVSQVSESSASGLRVGDVIVAVNGTRVATVPEVNVIKDEFSVGDTLALTIFRDGGEITVESVLMDQADVAW